MERIAMSQEERDDLHWLKRVEAGSMTQREAAEKMGVTARWVRKLVKRMKKEGDAVVVRFRDTGTGVADPEGLFRPFHRSTGVKGLGLYVSRAIAHSFSGELKYVPLPSGSCFAVELVPLREWQKVAGGYESATAAYKNSSS